jgi:hypothetical protein
MNFFALFRRNRTASKEVQAVPALPEFKEVFELVTELLITDPFDSTEDSIIEAAELKEILLTLIVGLREYLAQLSENSSEEYRSMERVGQYLEAAGVKPIAYTQWNQSPVQGVAARIILRGKTRTALFGNSRALVRNTAPMRPGITEIVEGAISSGNNTYILAIDGLAYGVYEISQHLQEIVK